MRPTTLAGGSLVAVGLPTAVLALVMSGLPGESTAGSEVVRAREQSLQIAQGFEWFWALNGPVAADRANDLSVDQEGNVFLAGDHSGLDLDQDGVVDLASGATVFVGARNPLFMKLVRDPSDDRLHIRWIRSPSTPADRSQTRVAADQQGGAYVSGAFMESVSFEDGPTLVGAGGNDAFIARYDGEGAVMWAHAFGGSEGGDLILGLASDSEGNAYVAAMASGTFALDDQGTRFASEGRAAVLLSYTPDGGVRWQRTFGRGAPLILGVWVSPAGQLYVSGELEGAADLDGDGTIDLAAPRDRDGFIARFSTEGDLLGAWPLPMPGGIALSSNGDVFVGAPMGGSVTERYGPVDFDGDGRSDVEFKGGGSTGSWVARSTAEGVLRWVRSYALEGLSDLEVQGDRIVIAGNFKGVRDLDEDGRPEPVDRTVDPSLETDLAILVLSAADGRPERVWTAPGPGNDVAATVAFLPDRPALAVAGAIQITADFTGDGQFGEGWVVCENRGDIFVAQYRLDPRREEREESAEVIALAVSVAEGDANWRMGLVWSGAQGPQVDIYQNDELITTVPNTGDYTALIRKNAFQPPYAYRVCEEGSTRCSAAREAGG